MSILLFPNIINAFCSNQHQKMDAERVHFLQKRTNARIEKWRNLMPTLDEKVAKKKRSRKCIDIFFFFFYVVFENSEKKNKKRYS